MHDLLNRYLAGEHEAVWRELGTHELPGHLRGVAESIAIETMRRVRRNLDLLVDRLSSEGFRFNNPPSPKSQNANGRYECVRALPTKDTDRLIHEIEGLAGELPLSVKAFYREV